MRISSYFNEHNKLYYCHNNNVFLSKSEILYICNNYGNEIVNVYILVSN